MCGVRREPETEAFDPTRETHDNGRRASIPWAWKARPEGRRTCVHPGYRKGEILRIFRDVREGRLRRGGAGSGEEVGDDASGLTVGEGGVGAVAFEDEGVVGEAEEVEEGGVPVVVVDDVGDGVVAPFVCCAVDVA